MLCTRAVTWIVLVVSKVTVVLLLAGAISLAAVCVHGVCRKPGPLPPPKSRKRWHARATGE
jgi:hypothetical protein